MISRSLLLAVLLSLSFFTLAAPAPSDSHVSRQNDDFGFSPFGTVNPGSDPNKPDPNNTPTTNTANDPATPSNGDGVNAPVTSSTVDSSDAPTGPTNTGSGPAEGMGEGEDDAADGYHKKHGHYDGGGYHKGYNGGSA
ncbi:hypothetical protein D9756_005658 [Leucocoprinus leucothites]|uniref:Uncharacterized protein n=1 Tax=Leucocoprinus leucothites TaxID=201217 RepID=A0A8H5D8H5_9AGAR|nr:hypothetical protein D9756_005658 [Leucoagaricus leucothites]